MIDFDQYKMEQKIRMNFPYGIIREIHSISNFQIIECEDKLNRISFMLYIDGDDTHLRYETFDTAILGGICCKYGEYEAYPYIMRILLGDN